MPLRSGNVPSDSQELSQGRLVGPQGRCRVDACGVLKVVSGAQRR